MKTSISLDQTPQPGFGTVVVGPQEQEELELILEIVTARLIAGFGCIVP